MASVGADGFRPFLREELIAPPLLWPEVRSALHEAAWRGELPVADARAGRANLDASPIHSRSHARLGEHAWEVADRLGWAKTYDAEYLALAILLGCRLATLDKGLRDAAARLSIPLLTV